jgi:membrane-associated protease RseP (regulator of RpoE activity)
MDAAPPRVAESLLARFPFVHVGLFLATLATTVTLSGLSRAGGELESFEAILLGGLPFATALVSILLCHEMGHYLMARAYGVDSSLPFFIPVPFGVGTFGAIIRIRSAMPSPRAVLDIGAAGPFAGFAVALPLYAWGLAHSQVHLLGDLALERGNATSLLDLARALLHGEAPHLLAATGLERYGDSIVTALLQRAIVGPVPADAVVLWHPVAFAAWIGLFITTLNLIPVGQLDGGHVTFALLGERRALLSSRVVAWLLLAAGVVLSWNWLLWWVIARFFVGPRHPAPLELEPLDGRRRALAIAALVLFAVTFVPVPVSL